MRFSAALRIVMTVAVAVALRIPMPAQDAPGNTAPSRETPAGESKGMPPRAAPTEYQAHAQAGNLTVAAEFVGHSVPTPEATYNTEDFVIVEVGLFGPPETRAQLSLGDFSLRINGKKTGLPSQPYGMSFPSLKDPEWEPPIKPKSESKPMLDKANAGDDTSFKPVIRMPIDLKRTMQQRVQKASMPEGDRPLPAAGLLFFEFRGKTQSIRSLELTYSGPAGNVSVPLQP